MSWFGDDDDADLGPAITIDDLAAEIGLSVERIGQWLQAGRGPVPLPASAGGVVRFSRRAVDQWLLGR